MHIDQAGLALRQRLAFVIQDGHRHAGQRLARRPGLAQRLMAVQARHVAEFTRTIGFVNHRAPPVDHRALDVGRARGAGGGDETHRAQVVALFHAVGQRQQPHVHRGHQVGVGEALRFDQLQRALGVEALFDEQLGAHLRRPDAIRIGCAVVHRRAHQRAHAGLEPEHVLEHLEAAFGQLGGGGSAFDALGPARRARGVEHRTPRRAGLGRQWRRRVTHGFPVAFRPVPRGSLSVTVCNEGRAFVVRQLAQAGEQFALGNEHLGAAVGKDVVHLVGLEMPIDRAPQRADPARGQHHFQGQRPVAQHQRDAVALTHAGRAQCARSPQGSGMKHVSFNGLALKMQRRGHGGRFGFGFGFAGTDVACNADRSQGRKRRPETSGRKSPPGTAGHIDNMLSYRHDVAQ